MHWLTCCTAAAGWPMTYVEAPGLIHVFALLPLVPEARRAWHLTREFLVTRP